MPEAGGPSASSSQPKTVKRAGVLIRSFRVAQAAIRQPQNAE